MELSIRTEQKCCIDCGSTSNLVELEGGKYGCINCLNKIAQEQKELFQYFTIIMKNYGITNPRTQINTLLSIVAQIEIENNLASPLLLQEIEETKHRMFDNVQEGGTCLSITFENEEK